MRHTNPFYVLKAVLRMQENELKEALAKWKGSFFFPSDTGPWVEYYGNGPASAQVQSLRVDDSGNVTIDVRDDRGISFEISPEDLYPGAACTILENMPEPFREGEQVRWKDPEADEYGVMKEAALARVFSVMDASNQEEILIVFNKGGITSAEVPFWELERLEAEERTPAELLPAALVKALSEVYEERLRETGRND